MKKGHYQITGLFNYGCYIMKHKGLVSFQKAMLPRHGTWGIKCPEESNMTISKILSTRTPLHTICHFTYKTCC